MEQFFKPSYWMSHPDRSESHETTLMLFRKTISYQDHQDVTIAISASSKYKLYINDQLIHYGPQKGDNQVWYYDTLTLTPYLKEGDNQIVIAVLTYPLNAHDGNYSIFRYQSGLYLKGDLQADATWQCALVNDVHFKSEDEHFAPLHIYEEKKGHHPLIWRSPRIYINGEVPHVLTLLKPRTIPLMAFKERRLKQVMAIRQGALTKEAWMNLITKDEPLHIPAHSQEVVELSSGEEICAFLRLYVSKGQGSHIRIMQAEAYRQEGTIGPAQVPVKTLRDDAQNGYLEGYFDDWYIDEENSYEPFWFRTFRYLRLEITTGEEELILQKIQLLQTGYPLKVKTTVKIDDPVTNEIYQMSLRTLTNCMHETYIDCPYYEQLQYVMDTRLQALYTYSITADDRLARQAMDDFARSQRYDGLLNACYPNMTPNVIPVFSIYFILMVHDHMMYFGDRQLVRHYLPMIDRILNFFHEHLNQQGLVGQIGTTLMDGPYWSFIDWAGPWMDTTGMPSAGLKGPLTMESLLYLYGLMKASELYDYAGFHDQAYVYHQQADQLRMTIQSHCVNKQGMITDGPGMNDISQHCQVFGILTETIDIINGKHILEETIKHPDRYAQCTIAMKFYLFRALEKTGLYHQVYELFAPWRKMLEEHASTCYESENYARSECHAWGAVALYELSAGILGVEPAAPGYTKVSVRPHSDFYDQASGKVITPHGYVYVSWKKEQSLILDVQSDENLPILK